MPACDTWTSRSGRMPYGCYRDDVLFDALRDNNVCNFKLILAWGAVLTLKSVQIIYPNMLFRLVLPSTIKNIKFVFLVNTLTLIEQKWSSLALALNMYQ